MSNHSSYIPTPLIADDIAIEADVIESIAKNIHEVWAQGRLNDGWRYGIERNDSLKQTPCLVPYDELSEIEKEYDRRTAKATISTLHVMGYKIYK